LSHPLYSFVDRHAIRHDQQRRHKVDTLAGAVAVYEHRVTSAAYVRKREQRRRLVDVCALRITRVGALAVSRRGDVVYPARVELRWVNEREEIREKSPGAISSGGSG
jgi:hypothetical protein